MHRFWNRLSLCLFALLLCVAYALPAQAQNALADSTLVIIRHAEKPQTGRTLNAEGYARAAAYAHYFHPLLLDGSKLELQRLIAGADAADSIRPRETLEPLARATALPLDTRFNTNDPAALVHALQTEAHAQNTLIAWRHKRIAALLNALGANANALLPDGRWPDEVFDWIVLLHFDATGKLDRQELLHEPANLR